MSTLKAQGQKGVPSRFQRAVQTAQLACREKIHKTHVSTRTLASGATLKLLSLAHRFDVVIDGNRAFRCQKLGALFVHNLAQPEDDRLRLVEACGFCRLLKELLGQICSNFGLHMEMVAPSFHIVKKSRVTALSPDALVGHQV